MVRGDRKAAYETIIGVLDIARELEATKVALATKTGRPSRAPAEPPR
jgi:biopolymer transport protein ExbD